MFEGEQPYRKDVLTEAEKLLKDEGNVRDPTDKI